MRRHIQLPGSRIPKNSLQSSAEPLPPTRSYSAPSRPGAVDAAAVNDDDELLRPVLVAEVEDTATNEGATGGVALADAVTSAVEGSAEAPAPASAADAEANATVTSVLVTPVARTVTRGVAKVVHAPLSDEVLAVDGAVTASPAEGVAEGVAAKPVEDASASSSMMRRSTLLPPTPQSNAPVPVFRPPGAGRTTPSSMPAIQEPSPPSAFAKEEDEDIAVIEEPELTREMYAEMVTLASVSRTRPPPPRQPAPPAATSASLLSSLAIEEEEENEMTQVVYVRPKTSRSRPHHAAEALPGPTDAAAEPVASAAMSDAAAVPAESDAARSVDASEPASEVAAEVAVAPTVRRRLAADDETPTLMFAPSSVEILLPVPEKDAAESPANTATQPAVQAEEEPAVAVEAKSEDRPVEVATNNEEAASPAVADKPVEATAADKPVEVVAGAIVEDKPVEAIAADKPVEAIVVDKPVEVVAEAIVEDTPVEAARAVVEAVEPPAPRRAEVDDAEDPLLGLVIDERYRLEKVIGSGGMSRVYQASHVRSGGKLAIKIIELHLSHRPDTMKRCEQEARAMMEIQSNHVVRAHDVGTFPTGQLYVVMELLNGETLEDMIKRDGPIPWDRVATMALQICSGLTAGHKRGIFHRDVKPQNCMRVDLDDNVDHVKLIDFGLARDMNSGEAGVTQEGIILGTPEYMAPELIASRATPDARSDVYALGATMYKLLTGSAVFHEKNALDTLFQHKHTAPRPPSQVAPDLEIPGSIDAIVMQALAKDPAQRFVSVDEMAQRLRVALGRSGPESGRFSASAVRERSQPTVAAGVVDTDAVPAASPSARPVTGPSVVVSTRPVTSPSVVVQGSTRPVTNPSVVVQGSTRPVTNPSVVVQRRPPPAPAPMPLPMPPPVADQPFPWVRTAAVLVGLIVLAMFVWPRPRTTDAPPKIAGVGPHDQGTAPSARSPKIPPRDVKAPPAPVVAPAADSGPVEPEPTDDTPSVVLADTVPDVKSSRPGADEFNFRSARSLIAEQHDYLRQTCMKKGREPLRVLKFRISVKPSGRSQIVIDADPAVRTCVRTVLGFGYPPSTAGASFDYTLWLADSRLDRRTR
jgi:serine/threonine protein kinase